MSWLVPGVLTLPPPLGLSSIQARMSCRSSKLCAFVDLHAILKGLPNLNLIWQFCHGIAFVFAPPLLPNLLPWELTLLHVETGVVMPEQTEQCLTGIVGFLALVDPMSGSPA